MAMLIAVQIDLHTDQTETIINDGYQIAPASEVVVIGKWTTVMIGRQQPQPQLRNQLLLGTNTVVNIGYGMTTEIVVIRKWTTETIIGGRQQPQPQLCHQLLLRINAMVDNGYEIIGNDRFQITMEAVVGYDGRNR